MDFVQECCLTFGLEGAATTYPLLLLQIEAVDASGRQWLSRSYHDQAEDTDYPVEEGTDPFADLYRQIANDLLAQLEALEQSSLAALRHIALLRYAATLSEEAFGPYLNKTAAGYYQLLRLPAADDPMLARVQRIRNQEHLFIDTVRSGQQMRGALVF